MNTFLAQVTVTTSGDAGGAGVVGSVVWLVVVVAMLVAMWKVFTKAGQPGWASLIPIYNTLVMLRITGRSGWWLLGMFVPFLNFFVVIRLIFDLAKVFGRGIGFGFGLLFLFPIFLLILAFGDAEYLGPDGPSPRASAGGFAPAPAPAPLAP
jgi:hypothetical protein